MSADGKTEAMVYANSNGGWVIAYFAYDPEDLVSVWQVEREKTHNKFGFLLKYSYLCHQEEIHHKS